MQFKVLPAVRMSVISGYNGSVYFIACSSLSRDRGRNLTSWRDFSKSAEGMEKVFIAASGSTLNRGVYSILEFFSLLF